MSIWLDTRNAANNTDSQLFYSYSIDGGNTWSPNVAVSNSFNPFLGYPNQNKMGDYMTLVSDNTGANVAYCATFNGEEDIYYVRVTTTPAPTPTTDGNADIIWQNTSIGERLIWDHEWHHACVWCELADGAHILEHRWYGRF